MKYILTMFCFGLGCLVAAGVATAFAWLLTVLCIGSWLVVCVLCMAGPTTVNLHIGDNYYNQQPGKPQPGQLAASASTWRLVQPERVQLPNKRKELTG